MNRISKFKADVDLKQIYDDAKNCNVKSEWGISTITMEDIRYALNYRFGEDNDE